MHGFAGDTLASALLGNGVRVVGRSFKYHRKRGVFAIGSEEPNALVQIGNDDTAEPNTRATMVDLAEGMQAFSQNHWPSLGFDVQALTGFLAPVFGPGFYYKTFIRPHGWWMKYERILRRAAGIGRAPRVPDAARYEHCFAHCDVLVVGAGPAGLRAAHAAAVRGADVWLVDENAFAGGWLNRERASIDGDAGADWAGETVASLERMRNVTVKMKTTAFGYYDHNLVALAEHLSADEPSDVTQRLWRLRATQVILATGATERSLVFAGNDLPGVMLAGAARAYVNQYGVNVGNCALVFTTNDSAYRTVADLHDAGVRVAAIVDCRSSVDKDVLSLASSRGVEVLANHVVIRTQGRGELRAVLVRNVAGGAARKINCDLLAVSGGWSPSIQLHAQSGGRSAFEEEAQAIVPTDSKQASQHAGSVRGTSRLNDCLADGYAAGCAAAGEAGFKTVVVEKDLQASLECDAGINASLWQVVDYIGGKSFVDLQNDVTAGDISQAHGEGYRSIEHLKRYTTLGMGTDQGKTSNVSGIALLARHRGEPMLQVGTTTFRPPYTPVTMATVAGPEIGARLMPVRRSPIHDEHVADGAIFDDNSLWKRAKCYRGENESVSDSIIRETIAVRNSAGIADVSTLGKFEVQGEDSAVFIERVYANSMATLVPGRSRYAIMLREDGAVFDDGTLTCMAPNHYFLTTSTSHEIHVHEHLEYLLDAWWPELEVNLTRVTDYWSAVAVAGPEARALLKKAGMPPSADDLQHMSFAPATIMGIEARIMRLSFSGEWACEIYVAASNGARLWRQLRNLGAVPYGLDAMDALRIEKGYIGVGAEADGRTSPVDLGLPSGIRRTEKFLGRDGLKRLHERSGDRLELVGLIAEDSSFCLNEGAQLVNQADEPGFGTIVGHLTSAAFSPTLQRYIALALLRNGRSQIDGTVNVMDPMRGANTPGSARVTLPLFYDPESARPRR